MRKNLKNNYVNDDNIYPEQPEIIVLEENPVQVEIVEAYAEEADCHYHCQFNVTISTFHVVI